MLIHRTNVRAMACLKYRTGSMLHHSTSPALKSEVISGRASSRENLQRYRSGASMIVRSFSSQHERNFNTRNRGTRSSSSHLDPASSSQAVDARKTIPKGTDGRYLHLAPSGDSFVGDQMFAAKHLSSDYLKSIKITDDPVPDASFEDAVEAWCSQASLAELQAIYDSGALPEGNFPKKG